MIGNVRIHGVKKRLTVDDHRRKLEVPEEFFRWRGGEGNNSKCDGMNTTD